jgi:ankyrin repeat protein
VLHLAASLGDPEMMALLLSSSPKALIDGATESGQRPLHYAASKGHLQVVRLLLDAQADLRLANRFGQTPLHRAASLGRVGVVQCMVDHAMATFGESSEIRLKAWLDAKDGEGWTAVQMAAETGTEDGRLVIQCLVDAGADPNMNAPESN